MTDRIHVSGVSFAARIGTTAEEREQPQALLLDLAIALDLEAAANTGDLGLTVNYVTLVEKIEALARESEFILLETLASQICREILRDSRVETVQVKLQKFPAVLKGRVSSVAVELERNN